jgi:hypothetical protein
MPNKLIAVYAKRARTSEAHVEQLWKKAKDIAYEKFKSEKVPAYWPYVNAIVKRELQLEGKMSFTEYLLLVESEEKQE